MRDLLNTLGEEQNITAQKTAPTNEANSTTRANGKAKVVAGTTPAGKKEAELGRGEFFGELSLLDGDSRSRTVVAETPLETVRIERSEFRKLLRKEPDLAIRLLEGMAKRTRKILDTPAL